MTYLDYIIGVEEAAEILGLSPGRVKNKAAANEIPAKKIGKQWIFNKKQLEAFKMSKFAELNNRNSTIITVEGIEYRTTQHPYLADNGEQYVAQAVDMHDNEYTITWDINHPDFENLEDESEACDWDNPVSVDVL